MSALTEQVRKALEGFNNSRLDNAEIEYFADNAPTWLAALCDRVEELEKALEIHCEPCKELVVVGSDGCAKCEDGRVTMYTQGKYCLSCKHALRGSDDDSHM